MTPYHLPEKALTAIYAELESHLGEKKAKEVHSLLSMWVSKTAPYRDYDAGLLNDWGGGNVDWWQDYIRSEIEHCNDHWRQRIEE